ncbi:50S ribosomal protein L25/general stress protein Ctc [Spongorhabdus nitratireducens]
MSEAIVLNAEARADVGKGASRRLRHAEKVPAVIYGGDVEPSSVVLLAKDVKKALESEAFYSQIVTLMVDGAEHQVILKDLQRHPARDDAMHMDFQRVSADQAVTTHVPLHFLNEEACAGVKAGGAITHDRVEVSIRCLPADLPEFIEVDMAAVELGQIVHLSDLNMPENVALVDLLHGEGHDLPVASVIATRATKESEEESEEASE